MGMTMGYVNVWVMGGMMSSTAGYANATGCQMYGDVSYQGWVVMVYGLWVMVGYGDCDDVDDGDGATVTNDDDG